MSLTRLNEIDSEITFAPPSPPIANPAPDSFLLMHDADLAIQKKIRAKPIVDGWSNRQTTHRETQNAAIKSAINRLSIRFAERKKVTQEEVLISIQSRRPYLLNQGLDEATLNWLMETISFFMTSNKHQEYMQLCWTAVMDENERGGNLIPAELQGDELTNYRIKIYLATLYDRLTTEAVCDPGKRNAIYEALQGLHPLAEFIIDDAAMEGIISYACDKTLYQFLTTNRPLVTQLAYIKKWIEAVENGEPIFYDEPASEAEVTSSIISFIEQKRL